MSRRRNAKAPQKCSPHAFLVPESADVSDLLDFGFTDLEMAARRLYTKVLDHFRRRASVVLGEAACKGPGGIVTSSKKRLYRCALPTS